MFAPAFVGVFFVAMATVQGVPGESLTRLNDGWTDAVLMNYKIWPLAQYVRACRGGCRGCLTQAHCAERRPLDAPSFSVTSLSRSKT